MNSCLKPLELADARQMLQYIPAHDRKVWIPIGMALKSEYANDGFSLFDEWSRAADNYDIQAVKSSWRSFKDGKVKIGTLFHYAKQNGWRPDVEHKPLPISKAVPAPKPTTSKTGKYASELWMASNWEDSYVASHQYAINKDINWAAGAARGLATGSKIGQKSDCLIIPIRNIETNRFQGVECINSIGCKQNFGEISGGTLILGNTLDKSLEWYVAEGWSTAVSVVFHIKDGNSVCAVSFGKTNLRKTAELIDKKYHPRVVTILTEVD